MNTEKSPGPGATEPRKGSVADWCLTCLQNYAGVLVPGRSRSTGQQGQTAWDEVNLGLSDTSGYTGPNLDSSLAKGGNTLAGVVKKGSALQRSRWPND